MKCPICKAEIKDLSYGMEEYHHECKNCNLYRESFFYGSTEIQIGDFTTGFHYSDKKEGMNKLNKKISKLIEMYQEDYKEQKNKNEFLEVVK